MDNLGENIEFKSSKLIKLNAVINYDAFNKILDLSHKYEKLLNKVANILCAKELDEDKYLKMEIKMNKIYFKIKNISKDL